MRRTQPATASLKMKEGNTGQERKKPLEAKKDNIIESPLRVSRRNMVLLTP